jgi:hypothetical protein
MAEACVAGVRDGIRSQLSKTDLRALIAAIRKVRGQEPPPSSPLNSTRSSLITVLAVAVCAIGSLNPSVAWPEVVLVKKGPAAPAIYVSSVSSNQFPSSKQTDCASTDFSCMNQGRTGPVPDALKTSYAKELRDQGLTVVTMKPSESMPYEVSVSVDIRELPSSPPIVPKRFVCDVNGMIARYDATGNTKQLEELQAHNIEVHPLSEKANHLVLACL